MTTIKMETELRDGEPLAKLIKRKCNEFGIAKADLAELIGKSRPTVDRWTAKPTKEFLILIADLFSLNRIELLNRYECEDDGSVDGGLDPHRLSSLRLKGKILKSLPLKFMRKEQMVSPSLSVPDQISELIAIHGFETQREMLDCLQHQSFQLNSSYNRTQSTEAADCIKFQALAMSRKETLKGTMDRERLLQFADLLAKASATKGATISFLREELSKRGVHFRYMPKVTKAGVRGFTMRSLKGDPIIGILTPPLYMDTFYFALAHELAHVIEHWPMINEAHFSTEDKPSADVAEMEAFADRFAVEKLMPEPVYHQLAAYLDTDEGLREMASMLGVNPSVFYGMYCNRTGFWARYGKKRIKIDEWFGAEAKPHWDKKRTGVN